MARGTPITGRNDSRAEPGDIAAEQPIDPVAALAAAGGGDSGTGNDDSGNATDGTTKRTRAKRGEGKAKTTGPVSVSGIESVLFSAHLMLSAALQEPNLALSKEEAHGLAEAAAEVARHYPTTIDPKMMAWANLAMAVGLVYGPRVYTLTKGKKKTRTSADVVQFNPLNPAS